MQQGEKKTQFFIKINTAHASHDDIIRDLQYSLSSLSLNMFTDKISHTDTLTDK